MTRRCSRDGGVHGARRQWSALWAAVTLATLLMFTLLGACNRQEADDERRADVGRPPSAEQIRLVVSRDFGGQRLKDILMPARTGMTAMRVLAEHCTVDTAYGGGFVSGIDGLQSSSAAGGRGGDWFYWIDGRMGAVGAADQQVRGGQTVWWDYHEWSAAMYVPGSLDAFPAPFNREDLVLLCSEETRSVVADWAKQYGIRTHEGPRSFPYGADLGSWILADTPASAAADPSTAPILAAGPDAGVFVSVRQGRLGALKTDGKPGDRLQAAALAVPDPNRPERLCLLLIADDAPALESLLAGFTPAAASAHVALGLRDGRVIALPETGQRQS